VTPGTSRVGRAISLPWRLVRDVHRAAGDQGESNMLSAHKLWVIVLPAALLACGGNEPGNEEPTTGPAGKADSLQGATPTLVFDKSWSEWASGPIFENGNIAIDYDESRLPTCRASHNGNPGWQITAYVAAMPSGKTIEAPLFNYASGPTGPNYYSWVKQVPVLNVPAGTTELQVWFKNVSGFDHPCEAWDSDYGKNYRFSVQKAPAPSATLTFKADWSIAAQGKLAAGSTVSIDYDVARLKAVIDGANPLGYFASKYHCYGYGCCSHTYDNKLHARFSGGGSFSSVALTGAPVQITIPQGAQTLELYFETAAMTTLWYCGGGTGPKTTYGPDVFYDSNYGKNFLFGL